MKGSVLSRLGMIAGGIFALALFARTLVEARSELQTTLANSRVLQSFALSTFALVATYLVTVAVWRRVIRQFGSNMRYTEAIQLWSFSNLGRYLPGKVWQVVGIAVLGKPLGISPATAGAIAVVNLGFMVGTGGVLGAYFLPESIPHLAMVRGLSFAGFAGLLLPVAWPRLIPTLVRRLPARWGGGISIEAPSRRLLLSAVAAFTAIWILQGAAFFILLQSWQGLSLDHLPRLTGAYSLSYVIGLLAVFAPGGVGVRESVLAEILRPLSTSDFPVHLAVVGSRFSSLIAELLVLILAVFLRGAGRRGETANEDVP